MKFNFEEGFKSMYHSFFPRLRGRRSPGGFRPTNRKSSFPFG